MKFYNRILGNRDYTLLEVVHHGLRLPPVISSFGEVQNASLSSWRALKRPEQASRCAAGERITYPNKSDIFSGVNDLSSLGRWIPQS